MLTGHFNPHVVILGGGFGGLEAAFYLRRLLGDAVRLTLISDQDRFLFKPNTIYIPFGLDPERLMIPLSVPAARKEISLLIGPVRDVDPERQRVHLDGREVEYDYLVVATGAGMRPEEIPGLAEHAHTIWTPEEMLRLRAGIGRLVEAAREGRHQEVLFLVPPNNKCSGPLYELVFMLDVWLRRQGVRSAVNITYTTYERGFIQAFGPRLHTVVLAEFRHRDILGHTEYVVDHVEPGRVFYKNGEVLPYDLLISFPPYVAAARFSSLPADDRGFIQTELQTRRVKGHPNIYAVGDAADFPVKQAFLALLQADAAAHHLAAQVTGREPEALFEPTSMCVMEQLDKATFAQVPLALTGRPELPVEVRSDALGQYKVGTSRAWRLGKALLGLYLPWRFRNGEPFHAGAPWKAMEVGLKVMSAVLAR